VQYTFRRDNPSEAFHKACIIETELILMLVAIRMHCGGSRSET